MFATAAKSPEITSRERICTVPHGMTVTGTDSTEMASRALQWNLEGYGYNSANTDNQRREG